MGNLGQELYEGEIIHEQIEKKLKMQLWKEFHLEESYLKDVSPLKLISIGLMEGISRIMRDHNKSEKLNVKDEEGNDAINYFEMNSEEDMLVIDDTYYGLKDIRLIIEKAKCYDR